MKTIKSNIKFIWRVSIKYTEIFLAIVGFIGLFAPLNDVFSDEISLNKKVVISCLVVLGIWLIIFIISCFYIYKKRYYKIFYTGNGHYVYVQYGDVLSPDGIKKTEARNVAIAVNRCFDTIIDDELIAKRSLHGIVMEKLYANHIYTQEELDSDIQRQLTKRKVKYETIESDDKPRGNLKRYEPGTVVEILGEEGVTYFFLALASLDDSLHAHVSDDEYVMALIKMLVYINKRSQGRPLFMPLIGAGQSDTKKNERDILEYLVKLLKLNRNLINCDVHIVVYQSNKVNISIAGLE